MSNPRICEIKTTLSGKRLVFDCERIHYAAGEVIVSYRMTADHLLADVLLPAGSLSLGYFWEDRPYNSYHWVLSQTLKYNANVCPLSSTQ